MRLGCLVRFGVCYRISAETVDNGAPKKRADIGACGNQVVEGDDSGGRLTQIGNSHAISDSFGGEGGIRTHDTVSRIHAFQACALSHSATSPRRKSGAI